MYESDTDMNTTHQLKTQNDFHKVGSGNNSPIFSKDINYKFGSTAGEGFNKIRLKKSM